MEYCKQGTLKDYLHNNPKRNDQVVLAFLQQIAKCFKILQQGDSKLIHRDLKPKNIFISDIKQGIPIFKIDDFVISKNIEKTIQNATTSGTLQYCPPEVLFKSKQASNSDLWSLGIILYEMVCGQLPFEMKEGIGFDEVVNNAKFTVPLDLPEYVLILLKRLLVDDPSKRMKWSEFFDLFDNETLGSPSVVLMNGSTELLASSSSSMKIPELNLETPNIDFPILHYFPPFSTELHLWDLETQKHTLINLPNSPAKDQIGYGSIKMGDKIFICGGDQEKGETFSFCVKSQQFSQKHNMINKVCFHSLASANNKYFYSVGGWESDNVEKYSVEEDKWIPSPKLTQNKCSIGTTQRNTKYIMAIGGLSGIDSVSTIEELEIENESGGWKIITLLNNIFPPTHGCYSTQLSDGTILIIGGSFNVLVFDYSEKKINKISNLGEHVIQDNSFQTGIQAKGKTFIVFDKMKIYEFDEKTQLNRRIEDLEWKE